MISFRLLNPPIMAGSPIELIFNPRENIEITRFLE